MVARLANYYFENNWMGVQATLFMNNFDGFVERFIDPGVPRYPFNVPDSILVERQNRSLKVFLRAAIAILFYLPSLFAQIKEICRSEKIEIIHVHAVRTFVLIALPTKIAGCKLLFHLHDSFLSIDEGGVFSPINRRIIWFAMRYFADEILVVSEFVRQSVLGFDKGLANKIHVVHNGIDVAKIWQDKPRVYEGESPFIISYGVVTERKGFQVGIEAVSILKYSHGISARYQIIGDGPFLNELMCFAEKMSVSDLVEFVGFKDEVYQYVEQADIVLILPVYEDPLPLVVVEAMANSKIIIATRSGGISEMIRDGVDGYLVDQKEPDQVVEAIVRIMKNPRDANKVAVNGYKRACQDFSMESMAERIKDIYNSVL